jgi:hypothetical protein
MNMQIETNIEDGSLSPRLARSRTGFGAFVRVAALAAVTLCGQAWGATPLNPTSSLGTNLQPVNYYTSEQPFLNIFKTGGGWITHGPGAWDTNEEQYLNLDADGYPKTMTTVGDRTSQKFNSVGVLLLRTQPVTANGLYPTGQYVLLYDGQGTITASMDAAVVSAAPGRIVLNVAKASEAGIQVVITATDPEHTGNYIRNIRLVKAEYETSLNAGELFSPTFINLVKNFRALRFMDWFNTNGSTLSSWANRPLPSNAFWGAKPGVPIEVAVQLANEIGADAWLNVPIMADDNYITQMATVVHRLLGTSQRAYVELSNEVWNGVFTQNAYSIKQGVALFPQAMNRWYSGWEWYGMRVAQMSDLWYAVYGPSDFKSRVSIVMAGQAPNPEVIQEALTTPDWTGPGNGPALNHHIGVAAIAPYFFGALDAADLNTMLASSDGGLKDLFATVYSQAGFSSAPPGGWIVGQSNAWTIKTVKMLKPYGIPLVAYEGGQSMEGFPTYHDGSPQVNLFIAANVDPRMATAYTEYFNGWKQSGGTLFMQFTDSGAAGQFGEWGALTSSFQPVSPLSVAPPKWQAIQTFMASTPCWWAGCSRSANGAPTPTPQAPSGLKVQ